MWLLTGFEPAFSTAGEPMGGEVLNWMGKKWKKDRQTIRHHSNMKHGNMK